MIKTWKDQETPALAIVARGDQIASFNSNSYSVRSQSNPAQTYHVQKRGDGFTCTCEHYGQTGNCIHVLAIKFRNDLKESAKSQTLPTCEKCDSNNIVKNGKRHNKSGMISRFLCKDCGARFTDNNGFKKRRAEPEKIALALDLYYRGLSFRKVAEHLKQAYNLHISHMTAYRWVKQQSVSGFVPSALRPNSSLRSELQIRSAVVRNCLITICTRIYEHARVTSAIL